MSEPCKRRRRFQYSLRSLMLVVFLASLGMSWYAVMAKRARQQKEVVAEIRKRGGGVLYDFEAKRLDAWASPPVLPRPAWLRDIVGVDFLATVIGVSFCGAPSTDEDLKLVKRLPRAQLLYLESTRVTDVGLEHINGLAELRVLDLLATQVTDVGLEHINGLTELRELELGATQVTGKGLRHLKGMTKLRALGLARVRVADSDLQYIMGLTGLEELVLTRTRVTDAGLEHLRQLKGLRHVLLYGTKVTDRGVTRFQQALPKCGISFDDPKLKRR
jgi:hypothetical protein